MLAFDISQDQLKGIAGALRGRWRKARKGKVGVAFLLSLTLSLFPSSSPFRRLLQADLNLI